jgi:hypothetical protein
LRAGIEEEGNFPPVPPEATEANWQTTLDAFRASNKALRKALQKLDPAGLDELSAAGKRSFYDEAHGLIEHKCVPRWANRPAGEGNESKLMFG